MKTAFLLFLFALLVRPSNLWSQDTVRVYNAFYSNYEKAAQRNGTTLVEEANAIWNHKNLTIVHVRLTSQTGMVLSTALRFESKRADGALRLIPDVAVGYLDSDETDSLINTLEFFLAEEKNKPHAAVKTIVYNSRGAVYAACYMKNNAWRVAVTASTSDIYYYTRLTKQKLLELITVLKTHKSGTFISQATY